MTHIEVMKQALKALVNPWGAGPEGVADAITTLRQAIEQAEQAEHMINCPRCGHCCPQQRKPLTDELNQIAKDLHFHGLTLVKTVTGYAVLKLGHVTAHDNKE